MRLDLELFNLELLNTNRADLMRNRIMRYFSINKRWLKRLYFVWGLVLAVLFAILWQQVLTTNPSQRLIPDPIQVSQVNEPIQPIPLFINLDKKKVALGEKLFRDVRLSGDKKVACITCHRFDTGGADRKVRSLGVNGQLTQVNTPTVFNSAFNFKLNWDGISENLFINVNGALVNPIQMGGKWEKIIPMLQNSHDYAAAFAKAYPDGITKDNVSDAIATFEESLYTPNSRFDQFLRGNSNALTQKEKEGYNLFKDYGCVSCHQGINVGGNMFQKFGVMSNYFAEHGNVTKADWGRFNVTGQEKDRYVFRVPSLRNVELTPPYFHDGSARTLEQAVNVMVEYQLGRSLTSEQTNLMIQFLKTLTGEYQGKPLSQ
jgi:cytochrome c peroxidase